MARPAKPPRLPIKLIVAIPLAVAEPDRSSVGKPQSGGLAALIPTMTSTSGATSATAGGTA
jgi:hypothetical protein